MRNEPEKKVLDWFEANANNLFLVTRNEKDFLWIDNLSIVNPWDFDISKKNRDIMKEKIIFHSTVNETVKEHIQKLHLISHLAQKEKD